jgi:hypothetical protein
VQHIFIGAAAANAVVIGWGTVQNLGFKPLFTNPSVGGAIPVVLGILLYARYIRKISWLSRYSLAILVATGTGLGLRSVI